MALSGRNLAHTYTLFSPYLAHIYPKTQNAYPHIRSLTHALTHPFEIPSLGPIPHPTRPPGVRLTHQRLVLLLGGGRGVRCRPRLRRAPLRRGQERALGRAQPRPWQVRLGAHIWLASILYLAHIYSLSSPDLALVQPISIPYLALI